MKFEIKDIVILITALCGIISGISSCVSKQQELAMLRLKFEMSEKINNTVIDSLAENISER